MRTRRGVERHPTGDSDVLSEMMYQSASLREPRRRPNKADTEAAEEEATAKTQQESCDEEEVVAADGIEEETTTTKKKGPIRSRRGVQRQSTGDSDQLGLMLYGLAKGASQRTSDAADGASGGVPTEISMSPSSSSSSTTASETAKAAEPRRRGRRKCNVHADDSEIVEDSTNNDDN